MSRSVAQNRRRGLPPQALSTVGAATLVVGAGLVAADYFLGAHDGLGDAFLPIIIGGAFFQVLGLNALYWGSRLRGAAVQQDGATTAVTTRAIIVWILISPAAVVLLTLCKYALSFRFR